MGVGYVRQSSADIATGQVVEAGPINAEFNQLQSAFDASGGHSHDGTTGESQLINLTTSITGALPAANGGFGAIHKVNGTAAPTTGDDTGDGYGAGSHWVDTTNDKAYICVDATLGAAIWVELAEVPNVQPLDTDLTAIAALTSAASKVLTSTGAGTWALVDFTTFGASLVDDAAATNARTTLGLVIGTDVQAFHAYLTDLASITANQGDIIYFNGTDWVDLAPGTSGHFLKTQGAAANPAWAAVTGATIADADYGDITVSSSGTVLTIDADAVTYAKIQDVSASDRLLGRVSASSGIIEEIPISDFIQGMLDDTNAAAVLTTLGITADVTELSYTDGVTSAIQTQMDTKAPTASPTFTGTVVIPTPFTLGAVSVLPTGTELNFVDGVTSAIQTQLDTKLQTGKHAIYVPSTAFIAPTTTPAQLTSVELATNDIMIHYAAFDTSADEYVQFGIWWPGSLGTSTFTYKYIWSHAAAATFGVAFFLHAGGYGNDDAGDTAVGTAVTNTDTGGTTNDFYHSGESGAVTIANLAANDYIIFKLYRDVSDAGDTLNVDARVHGVMLYVTVGSVVEA